MTETPTYMYEGFIKIGGFIGFWTSFNMIFKKCHSKKWQKSMKHYFPKDRKVAKELKKKKRDNRKSCLCFKKDEEIEELEKNAYMDGK